MSLNNGHEPKASARSELSKLVNEYIARGGAISTTRTSKVKISCRICGDRRYADIGYAVSFGKKCCRCGSTTTIQWT